MSEYYLVKEPNQTQQRVIHRDDCSSLPGSPATSETLKYLGSYGNKDAAFSKARGLFDHVAFCEGCLS